MGEGFDLAAVASAAGLGGSAVAGIGAVMFFRGLIMRILAQIVVTAVLTGVGFLALLSFLGFEIVPKEQATAAAESPMVIDGLVRPQSVPSGEATQSAAAEDDGQTHKVYAVKSPWRS
ncbi:MAG: hypothetical protein R3C52_08160 [Hyphomonadaceae bacterium]